MKTLFINAIWDDEASVWVATSEDVPGLVTEASTCDDLVSKLKIMIPELLEANGVIENDSSEEIPFKLLSELTAFAHRTKHPC